MKKVHWAVMAILAAGGFAAPSNAQGNVVISQIFGYGRGSSSAKFNNDYVELYNRGATAASLAGCSLQYAGAAGTSWTRAGTTGLSGTIPPGKYYLVQVTITGTSYGDPLPTPDFITSSFNLGSTGGKVAFVGNNTTIPVAAGTNPDKATYGIIDLVGYGSAATGYEGTGPAPAASSGTPLATQAVTRKANGSTDTDNNASDFALAACNPRNSSAPANTPSSTITAAGTVCAGSTGNTASVPDAGTAATYAWTPSNCLITGGDGTRSVTYTAGPSGAINLGVTVSNSAGLSSIGSFAGTAETQAQISIQPQSKQVGSGAPATTFTVLASGVAPLSYEWYRGIPPSGTDTGQAGPSFTTSSGGTYYASVTDGCGTTYTDPATLTVGAAPTISSVTFSPLVFSRGMSSTVTATVVPGILPVASVTLNASGVLGSSTVALSNTGGNVWSATFASGNSVTPGAHTMAVNSSDTSGAPASEFLLQLTIGGDPGIISIGSAIHSSPTAYQGVVYFGADDGKLYAFRTSDLSAQSGFPVTTRGVGYSSSKILSRPALSVIGGQVCLLFTTDDGRVFCVNSAGVEKWRTTPLLAGASQVACTPAAVSGEVYVAEGNGSEARLYKLSATDGSRLGTSVPLGVNVASSPAVGAGGVFLGVTGPQGNILGLTTSDFTPLTGTLASGEGASTAPFIFGQKEPPTKVPAVFVGSDSGNVYAFNASNGTAAFGGSGFATMPGSPRLSSLYVQTAATGDGIIYVGAYNNKVYAVKTVDGSPAGPGGAYQFFDAGGSGKSITNGLVIDPVSRGGYDTVCFGSTDGRFYQVPLSNPAAYYVSSISGNPYNTTPSIDQTNNKVIVGNDDGNLYLFPRYNPTP